MKKAAPSLLRGLRILALLLLNGPPTLAQAQADPHSQEWVPLFNGEDLRGWDIKIAGHDLNDNYGDTFRVEGGVLRVSPAPPGRFTGRFGHLFHRERFSHYRLAVEYRFVGEPLQGLPDWLSPINSGVMIHAQSAPSMGKDQEFPVSLEVQLLGGSGSGETPTANLCPLGTVIELEGQDTTEDCLPSSSRTYRGDQWVRVEIRVLGGSLIEHLVEGEAVLRYRRPRILQDEQHRFDPSGQVDETILPDGTLLEKGHIALQSESHPVEFRKVELLPLIGCTDPAATNHKLYYRASDNRKCRYPGGP